MGESRIYRPSSGMEGQKFEEHYCSRCIHLDPDPEGERQCSILANALAFDITDDKYPTEWIYAKDGTPTCTAYRHWDWLSMGDPDDAENPNYVYPHNPNQLTLF